MTPMSTSAADPPAPLLPPATRRAVFWLGLVAGIGTAIYVMRCSTGAPLDDEIGHFLLSRDVWSEPGLALSLWGRTLNTLIYAVPATLGLEGTRWFSLAMTVGATFITWRLAQALSLRNAFLIPLFFWFQPWLLETSWACLTEVPFLLFLVAGLYALVRERPLAAGLLLGCLPLIRHEGIGIVVAGVAYGMATRNWRLAVALVAPYLVYSGIYRGVRHEWPVSLFLDPTPTAAYGSGGWLHFVPGLLTSIGPVLALAALGLPRLARAHRGMLVGSVYLLYLLIHVVIYRFGLYASGGYVVFLVPLVPLVAIAAVAGVDVLADVLRASTLSLPWRTRVPAHLAAVLGTTAVAAVAAGYAVRQADPHALLPEQGASIEAAAWIRSHNLQQGRIEATNVWVYYALPLPFPDPSELVLHSTPLDELPRGTLVVWDRKYSDGWGRPLSAMAGKPEHWRPLQAFGPQQEVMLFERL